MTAPPRDAPGGSGPSVDIVPAHAPEPDYYAVLGVRPDATGDEIRAAFRRLAKLWHPDHHANDPADLRDRAERRMRALIRAYGTVGTSAARVAYDQRRRDRLRASAHGTAGHPFAPDASYYPDVPAEPHVPGTSHSSADTFAGTLGGSLALLIALGLAAHLLRSGGASDLGGAVEVLAICGFGLLALLLFANATPLAHAADAYLAGGPRPRPEAGAVADPNLSYVFHESPAPPTAFELQVDDALATIPDEFHPYLENIVVRVQDEPTPDQVRQMRLQPCSLLLGLYEGVPLTWQGAYEHPPERITIFQRPIEEYCHGDPGRIRRQVRATVLHELAHHFGMDHDDMPAWIK